MKMADYLTLAWLIGKLVVDTCVVMYLIARFK